MSRMRQAVAPVIMGWLVLSAPLAIAENGVVSVPFVGCPADGQTGPLDAPSGRPVALHADAALARQIAYYKGESGPGVFAPRGWHCRMWYGSNGAFVIVTPGGPAPGFPASAVVGPGVEIDMREGETSGRFDVAEISARFFPEIMHDFIQQVRNEHLVKDADLDGKPESHDMVKKIGDRVVEFQTPAYHDGFGTKLFLKSNRPVLGIVALNPPGAETGLSILRLRLPPARKTLGESIIKIEEACLQKTDGC